MANVHFYTKSYHDDVQIFLAVTFKKGSRLRYYTGMKFPKEFWDASKQCVKSAQKFKQHSEVNACLRNLANEAERIIIAHGNKSSPLTKEVLKKELDIFRGKANVLDTHQITFFEFLEQFIAERIVNKTKYSPATIKVYKTTQNKLIEYDKSLSQKITFSSFKYDFFDNFASFIFEQGKKREEAEPFKPNYVQKIISTLNTVLKDADRKEISKELKINGCWNPVKKENVDSIYLSESEIKILSDLDLTNNKKLNKVRDLFLIGCHSGLRYSDYSQLKPENIRKTESGKLQINIVTQKTKSRVTVLIKSDLLAILEKYKEEDRYILPQGMTNQKMNKYLKELGELAGLNDKVLQTKIINRNRIENEVPKWTLISTHTARRSFATNAYKAKVNTKYIMQCTGHKTEKEFNKYLKLGHQELTMLVEDDDFFN